MADENEKKQFDYQGFSKSMATQAESLIPVDISDDNKKYIVNIIYNFCVLSCESILKDNNFSLQECLIVTQLIGEWTFHKSIDLTRAGILAQPRDAVLKDIAFTVFEIAKQAITKKLSQDQIISVIEHHVKKAYLNSLTTLKEKGIIAPENFDLAMGESNIDKMAQAEDANNPPQNQPDEEEFSTNKILKLASFAMILQKMPKDKVESVLAKLPQREAKLVQDYLVMDDLTSNANPTIMKYVAEIQKNMPKVEIKGDKLQHKLSKIVTKKNELKIDDIISRERDIVKKYINSIKEKKVIEISTPISNIIYEHLLEKVNK